MHVVASAQDQGGVDTGFIACDLLVHVAGQSLGIEIDEIFFAGAALGDDFAFCVQHQAGAVEDQAVISANLIHHHDRHFVLAGDVGQHVAPKFALANPEGRGGDVQHEVAAGAYQRIHGINRVERLGPEALVVPGVLADGQRHAVATKVEELLALGGGKIAHLVEDVVGGQQHLGLEKNEAAVHQQGG